MQFDQQVEPEIILSNGEVWQVFYCFNPLLNVFVHVQDFQDLKTKYTLGKGL